MYPDVTREARRHVSRHGEDCNVYNFTQTGTDDYGDPLFDQSVSETKMVFSIPGGGTDDKGPEGQKQIDSPSIRILDDVEVHPPQSDAPKATVIERVLTGEKYKVQTTIVDRTGVLQVRAEEYD